VRESVCRDTLWLAQTPQMFEATALQAALEAAACGDASGDSARTGLAGITDEASAMERAGYRPLLVPGSMRNFKVTWPDDFDVMERLLSFNADSVAGNNEREQSE